MNAGICPRSSLLKEATIDRKAATIEAENSGNCDSKRHRRLDGTDNSEPLKAIEWQVHVYGSPKAELVDWCGERKLPLQVFEWSPKFAKARDAVYLLRPDIYVALAEADGTAAAVERYFIERQLQPGVVVQP